MLYKILKIYFKKIFSLKQQTTNQTQTESLPPSPNTVSPVPLNNPTSAPRFGTVIPNRIFVGGIDFKVFFLILIDK